MFSRILSLGILSLSLLAVNVTQSVGRDSDNHTHDGKVVSITSSKLVMTNKGSADGKEHSHALASDAKVTLDGKACRPEDLKAGTKIRVTTKSADSKVATHIEGIDKQELFANTHDGKVVTITASKLVMSNKDGKEHAHSVSSDTKVTCDGKVCKTSDLKSGMKIRVTTKTNDDGIATGIEAIDKNAEFARRL